MQKNCRKKQHDPGPASPKKPCFLLAILLILTACASTDPFQKVENQLSEFHTSLRPREAACLIAEVLAYEFPATQSNPSQPRALVWRYGPEAFEIRYDRGKGSFLPSSNGYLLRLRKGIVQNRTIPPHFLGPIRFVKAPQVSGPIGAKETIQVRISKAGKGSTIQIQTSLNLLHREGLPLPRLKPLLDFVSRMENVCEEKQEEKAEVLSARVQAAFAAIGAGFSALQDDLLERGQLIRGNLLMMADRRNAAWLAYQSAAFYRPGRGIADRLRGRLVSTNARPEQARFRIAKSRLLAGPGSLRGRLLALEQNRLLQKSHRLQDIDATLAEGGKALLRKDWKTAGAYARRALDLEPGNAAALSLLARVQEGSGALGEALSTQLRVIAKRGENPALVQRLADLLQKNGRPHLALGRILRVADKHPDLLGTPLARKIQASLSPLDQLRLARALGKEKSRGLGQNHRNFASMLLLASPLGRIRPKTLPSSQRGNSLLSEPYEIDLSPGIRFDAAVSPVK